MPWLRNRGDGNAGNLMARSALYDDLIMDHIRNARNYREMENAGRSAVGANPLCGDELTVFVCLDDCGSIEDVSYQCTCCGITMASASLMTEHVKGRSIDDIRSLVRAFRAGADGEIHSGRLLDPVVRTVLEIVHQYPARQRCAALPWDTLGALLDGLPRRSGADAFPLTRRGDA